MDIEFKPTIADVRSGRGSKDVPIDRLATCLDHCARLWSLEFGGVLATDPAVVITARRSNGDDVVVKLCHDVACFAAERIALEAFGGLGSVELLASDSGCNALLLEFVRPGTPLRSLSESDADEEGCREAVNIVTLLHKPALPEHLRHLPDAGREAAETIERYLTRNARSPGPLPVALVERAASHVMELNDSTPEPVVLHGDLHHDNMLRSDRAGWLAIDPKGRTGDPAYEFAALIRNPIDSVLRHRDLPGLLEQRTIQVAELSGYDNDRVMSWTFAMAVVAACWQLEDVHAGWDAWLRIAEALS